MYKIACTETFKKDIEKLDKSVAKRIVNKILESAENPHNIKPLKYSPKELSNLCKLRVGDWRILFWADHKS